MTKYLILLLLVVSCGSNDAILRQESETIVDAHKIKISNAPEQRFETLGLQLFEEVGQDSYLSIEGKLQLPNIPDQFNKDLGCLDVTLDDASYGQYSSSIEVSTTGIIGQTFPEVSILLYMVRDQERLLLDKDQPTSIISFAAESSHTFTAQLCFELEYSEVPLQIYEGDISIRYIVDAENLQTAVQFADCGLDSNPADCQLESPTEIPTSDQSDDATAESDGSDSSNSGSETGNGDGQQNDYNGQTDDESSSDDGTSTDSESGSEAGDEGSENTGGDSQNQGNQNQSDSTSEDNGGSQSEPEAVDDSETSEQGDTSEQDDENTQDNDDSSTDEVGLAPASQCEALASKNGQAKPITKSGSFYLESKKYKITGNKSTAMFYLAADTVLESACLFLAGNQTSAQIIVDGQLDNLIIIGRGNSVSITVLANEGSNIGTFSVDFSGNNPKFTSGGTGSYSCPNDINADTDCN